jgi:hypothetical protein
MHPTEPQFQRIQRQIERLVEALHSARTERDALFDRVAVLEEQLDGAQLALADANTRQQLRSATSDPETPLALAPNTRTALRGQIDDMLLQIDGALRLMNE